MPQGSAGTHTSNGQQCHGCIRRVTTVAMLAAHDHDDLEQEAAA